MVFMSVGLSMLLYLEPLFVMVLQTLAEGTKRLSTEIQASIQALPSLEK
jgi:hypothetical protein